MTEETNTPTFDVVTEIKNAVAVIDHAAEQGAYRGWTIINQVLAVRGRLTAFIEMMEQVLRDQQAEASTEETAAVSVVTEEVTSTIPEEELPVVDATPVPEEVVSAIEQEIETTDNETLRQQLLQALAKIEELSKK